MFTFEGTKCQGPQAIMAKLTSLPFNQCKITPASMDFQPSISGGIIVFVTGHVQVRAEGHKGGGKLGRSMRLGDTTQRCWACAPTNAAVRRPGAEPALSRPVPRRRQRA